MSTRKWPAAFLLATSFMLVGCGSDSSDSSGNTETGASSQSVTAHNVNCAIAPESTVNEALGTSFGPPSESVNDPVTVCNYASTTDSQTGIVRFETGSDSLEVVKAGFTASGQPVNEVAGAGDEAFSSSVGGAAVQVNTVVVRKGDKNVQVVSQAPVDAELDLAKELLEKF